jgi:TPR repeat protein
MNSSAAVSTLAVCLAAAATSGCTMNKGNEALSCVVSSPLPLAEIELADASERALSGSAVDAFNLSSHFLRLNKLDEQKYWTQIAAENGHAKAQYALAVLLSDYGTGHDKDRARYWAKLASRCGVDGQPRTK